MRIKDVLEPREPALAIPTRGDSLILNRDGTGKTGWWKINPDRVPDRLVLYVRPEGSGAADILVGIVTGFSPSPNPKRVWVHFSNLKNMGSTRINWIEFADASQNPIRYVSG